MPGVALDSFTSDAVRLSGDARSALTRRIPCEIAPDAASGATAFTPAYQDRSRSTSLRECCGQAGTLARRSRS